MSFSRPGFTLVEVLVALVLLGVGAAALATALAGERRLRDMADAEAGVAVVARERLEALVVRRCDSASAGRRVERWGEERWTATPGAGAWTLVDTLAPHGVRAPILIATRISCPL